MFMPAHVEALASAVGTTSDSDDVNDAAHNPELSSLMAHAFRSDERLTIDEPGRASEAEGSCAARVELDGGDDARPSARSGRGPLAHRIRRSIATMTTWPPVAASWGARTIGIEVEKPRRTRRCERPVVLRGEELEFVRDDPSVPLAVEWKESA